MAGGRPPKYRSEFDDQARKLCLLGATDAELADFFGVDEKTINRWKKDHPRFCQSITRGKVAADAKIAEALYHRAKGYHHPEDDIKVVDGRITITATTKHYPPDTQAASLWLRNRQPKKWRDKQEIEHSGEVGITPPPPDEAMRKLRERLEAESAAGGA